MLPDGAGDDLNARLEQTAAEHPFDDGPAHEARVLERDVVVAGDQVPYCQLPLIAVDFGWARPEGRALFLSSR